MLPYARDSHVFTPRPSVRPSLLALVAALVATVLLGACRGAPAPPAAATPGAAAAAQSPSPAPTAQPAPAPASAPAKPAAPTAIPRSGSEKEIILATTTSTQDSGLLDVLVPMFEQQSGYQVKTISVGTGAALALGARGEADVVLVHAPESERRWMAQGNGTARTLVMHNDFVLAGPAEDPAKVRGTPAVSVAEALKRVAAANAPFISRGDNSGTHQLELALWKAAGLDPKAPGQSWYVESGTGMGQTLAIADQRRGYTLTDRATWLARQRQLALPILLEGDRALLNLYHVMPVNPAKFPTVKINAEGASAFARFLVTPETQSVIGQFGRDRYGQSLFFPDAGKREEDPVGPGA